MEPSLPTIAGFVSTTLFALGTLPMLTKAFRTKNLASYAEKYPSPNLATTVAIILVLELTVGMAENLVSALGEEIAVSILAEAIAVRRRITEPSILTKHTDNG